MMQEAEIRRLIRQGEDSYTEFKEAMAHPDDLAATIVAFANTDGGRLIVGVSDEGTVTGVPNTDRTMQRIDQTRPDESSWHRYPSHGAGYARSRIAAS